MGSGAGRVNLILIMKEQKHIPAAAVSTEFCFSN